MAAYLYDREVEDEEYIARVRRHRPSSLLPLVARAAAQCWVPQSWLGSPFKKLTPWNLADIARVSLVAGNEHRQSATSNDLLECCAAYSSLVDPQLSGQRATGEDVIAGFLLRKSAEQLAYNQSRFHDFGRTAAIFNQTSPKRALNVLGDPGWVHTLLGCTIPQYVGIGFIVHTLAVKHEGRFLEDWLDDPTLEPITSKIPLEVMRAVIASHFMADISLFRQQRPKFRPTPYRRFTFNPLIGKPIVSGISDVRLVPVPGLIDRKISPLGFWYAGFELWGRAFSDDVGELFEQYVGRQLGLIPNAVVYPEISYRDGRDEKLSVDWIVLNGGVVVLVEVKSARPTEPVWLGRDDAYDHIGNKLSKAFRQIDTTNQLIEDQHPEFRHIPNNLPRVGLIVTMEDFPIANAAPLRARLNICPSIPTSVCSSEELELLVTITDQGVCSFLRDFLSDPGKEGWSLTNDVRDPARNHSRNAVLDQAWASYTWGRPDESESGPQS